MIELLLTFIINTSDVQTAISEVNYFCKILNCPKPVTVSILPDVKLQGKGAYTTKIEETGGCAIHVRNEAIYRIDWLAHEACHCANDMDLTVAKAEREDAAIKCSQKLIEKWLLQGK